MTNFDKYKDEITSFETSFEFDEFLEKHGIVKEHDTNSFWNKYRDFFEWCAEEDDNDPYRWHILTDDPDDLPEYYKRVEIIIADKDTHELDEEREFTHYGIKSPLSDRAMNMWYPPYQYAFYSSYVYAWRYPKPTKEELGL